MTKLPADDAIDRIVSEYMDHCLKWAEKHQARDFVAGKKYARKLSELGAQLRHDFGDSGRERLAVLMDHPNRAVRTIAAADSLDFSSERAEMILESIASKNDFVNSLSARNVLVEWRVGRKQFPGGPVISLHGRRMRS